MSSQGKHINRLDIANGKVNAGEGNGDRKQREIKEKKHSIS